MDIIIFITSFLFIAALLLLFVMGLDNCPDFTISGDYGHKLGFCEKFIKSIKYIMEV